MIAYLILAHRAPEQLRRLVETVHHERNIYMIHVDRKSPDDIHAGARALARRFPNVHVLPSRIVNWSCWSMVDAELRGIRGLLNADSSWEYLINLSGACFPLVSQEEVLDRLADAGSIYMNHFDTARDNPYKVRWTRSYYLEFQSRYKPYFFLPRWAAVRAMDRIPINAPYKVPRLRRRFPEGATLYGGSQWMVLSREACHYALESAAARRFQAFFRFTRVPDESYFQTVLMNSPLAEKVVNDNLRYIRWPEGWALHPETLTKDDLPTLLSSGKLFARKFDPGLDPDVLARLTERVTREARVP